MITDAQKIEILADAVVGREHEVFSYDLNIANYEAMLAGLPADEWPEALLKFQNVKPADLPLDLNDDDYQLATTLQYRDQLRRLLRTEKTERGKSLRVQDALKTQIPAEEYDAAIAAAVVRRQQSMGVA